MLSKYSVLFNRINRYYLFSVAEKVYGPYSRSSDGRKIVIIVDEHGNKKTKSYPKYLVEQQLGYELDIDSTVDHWDSNKDNNNLDNLRVVPRAEHSADDTRRVKPVKFTCAWCDKEFERSPRLVRDKSKKKKAGPFCSRGCAGKYSRQLQLKLIDKFDAQPAVDSEYYKKKYVKAWVPFILGGKFIDYLCDIWEK